jgi:tRNA pseudouridine38-40 synthase
VRGVNNFLPRTIAVRWAQPVPETFHARFAAFERAYDYLLYVNPVRSPLIASRAGWMYVPLDVDAMRAAAAHLIGDHDFSAFRSSECQAKSPIKRLKRIDIDVHGSFIRFRFCANAFLHHMVRNIMGSLIAVGRAKHSPEWLLAVRESRDRRLAAPTFMPDGLYLTRVAYPEEFAIPEPDESDALIAHLGRP